MNKAVSRESAVDGVCVPCPPLPGRGTWDVLPAAGTGRQDLVSVEAPHVAVEFPRWTCPGRGGEQEGSGPACPVAAVPTGLFQCLRYTKAGWS